MAFMFESKIPATTLLFIPRPGGKSSHLLRCHKLWMWLAQFWRNRSILFYERTVPTAWYANVPSPDFI